MGIRLIYGINQITQGLGSARQKARSRITIITITCLDICVKTNGIQMFSAKKTRLFVEIFLKTQENIIINNTFLSKGENETFDNDSLSSIDNICGAIETFHLNENLS